jgi:hypothetical protein
VLNAPVARMGLEGTGCFGPSLIARYLEFQQSLDGSPSKPESLRIPSGHSIELAVLGCKAANRRSTDRAEDPDPVILHESGLLHSARLARFAPTLSTLTEGRPL